MELWIVRWKSCMDKLLAALAFAATFAMSLKKVSRIWLHKLSIRPPASLTRLNTYCPSGTNDLSLTYKESSFEID